MSDFRDLLGRAAFATGWALERVETAFRSAEGALHRDVQDVESRLEPVLQTWATAHAEDIFAILRDVKPILVTKHGVIVTRYDDVEEVLSREQVFNVPYAAKFAQLTDGGGFLLGVDGTPSYTRDLSTLQKAARREDLGTMVVPIVTGAANQAVAGRTGRLDVVHDLAEPVLERFVTEYFGTPSPSPGKYVAWATVMSSYLFLQTGTDPQLEAAALKAGEGMRAALEGTIAARKRNRGDTVDVLQRLLVLQDAGLPGCDDVSLRNNLLGLVVAAIPTTVAAVALIVDELLKRPAALAGAQDAARANDDRLLTAYCFEALRLNPVGPGVFRVAAAEYTVARGTARETKVPKGATVFAALQSAMMDDRALQHPREFRTDRPAYDNLLFGYGLHTCFGRYINAVQIPLIVKAILVKRGLRRVPGAEGTLLKSNLFPSSLVVEFE